MAKLVYCNLMVANCYTDLAKYFCSQILKATPTLVAPLISMVAFVFIVPHIKHRHFHCSVQKGLFLRSSFFSSFYGPLPSFYSSRCSRFANSSCCYCIFRSINSSSSFIFRFSSSFNRFLSSTYF